MTSRWLGSPPEGWRLGRLNQVAAAWTSNVDKHSVEGQVPVRLCNYTDVYKHAAIVEGMDFMSATATPEQVARFRLKCGDTVITKDSETADDIGVPAFVEYEADDLVCGYHLAIVRPNARVVPRYLYWVMGSQPTLHQWAVLASGVTRVGIRSTDLTKVAVSVPPLAEQRRIAEYLDRETAQIDELIAEQQRLIDLLVERRVAVVDRAVWSGIQETSMEPTGVDPAPAAPSHWRRVRNKDLFFETTGLSTDGSEELLTVSHLTGITPRSAKSVNMTEAESLVGYRIVAPGDLVINTMWAWMGALGVSGVGGVVSPAYGVYRLRDDAKVDFAYLDYLYRSRPYVIEMTRHSRGIWESRLRLYPETFLRLPIVVPPLAEQRSIARYLQDQTRRIDELIVEAERFIDLARDRRSALITAAVTGQIDIMGTTRRDQVRAEAECHDHSQALNGFGNGSSEQPTDPRTQ